MIFYRAHTRGFADHGWLKSFHTFSFAEYYHPERVQFGALRVLNDDKISARAGFGLHPHRDMEIITIPLKGEVHHKDSEGNQGLIKSGDVQVMSAGTGIYHSEYAGEASETELIQIWIYPKERGIKPRYDQKSFPSLNSSGHLLYVSPDGRDQSLAIHQDAFITRYFITPQSSMEYQLKGQNNLVFLMVLKGELELANEWLHERDGVGLSGMTHIFAKSSSECDCLILEVPNV
jgi:redox-sensitive bicupin YhaK (pirin superfamily)